MQIKIKTTKFELSDDIKQYVEKKMSMLEKYLGDLAIITCEVELERFLTKRNEGKNYRAEVNLTIPGDLLRVEKSEKSMLKAIDKVKDHLALMIKKTKEKKIDKKRGK